MALAAISLHAVAFFSQEISAIAAKNAALGVARALRSDLGAAELVKPTTDRESDIDPHGSGAEL